MNTKMGQGLGFERMDEHLRGITDVSLLVLKGHLLAKEILLSILQSCCASPGVLDNVEIGFFLKSRLARALTEGKGVHKLSAPDHLWPAVDALNALRNELAHSLDPKKLDQKARRLLSFVPSRQSEGSQANWGAQDLRHAISYVLGYLSCYEYIATTGEIPERMPSTNDLGFKHR